MAGRDSIREQWSRIRMTEAPRPEVNDDAEPESTPDRSDPRGTFITSGARFEGTLSLRGNFSIDTEFQGEIETDGTITIGPDGSVLGDLRAREVVIRGAVVGNVSATSQLIVEANAKLHGDIETACLEIQKHAFFRGSTNMTQPLDGRRPSYEPREQTTIPAAPAL